MSEVPEHLEVQEHNYYDYIWKKTKTLTTEKSSHPERTRYSHGRECQDISVTSIQSYILRHAPESL